MPNIILSYQDIKDIIEKSKPSGFSLIQYHRIVFSCEQDPILASLLATFPPLNFKSYYRKARERFREENTNNVHDPIFRDTREKTRIWLKAQVPNVPLNKEILLKELESKIFSAFHSRIEASATENEKEERITFFNYLISKYREGATGAETLLRALIYCLEKDGEDKENALTITFTSFEQARVSGLTILGKNSFSCLAGVDERILDGASVWRHLEEDITDINSETINNLVHPYITSQSSSLMPSNLLYSLYVHAIGLPNKVISENIFDENIYKSNPLELMKNYYKNIFSPDHLELLNSIVPFEVCSEMLLARMLANFNENKEELLVDVGKNKDFLLNAALQHQEKNLENFYCYYVINEALLRGLAEIVFNILNRVQDFNYFKTPLPCQDSVMAQVVVLFNEEKMFRFKPKLQNSLVLWLVCQNYTLSIKPLISLEPDLVNAEAFGYSALRIAAANSHFEMVKFLLGVPGIKINAVNKDGRAALGLAISNNYEIAELLVKNGASFHVVIEHAINRNEKNIFISTLTALIAIGCIFTLMFFISLLKLIAVMAFAVLRGFAKKDLAKLFSDKCKAIAVIFNSFSVASKISLIAGSVLLGFSKIFAYKQIELYKNVPLEKDNKKQSFIEGQNCAQYTLLGYFNYCKSFVVKRKAEELKQWRAGYIKELVKNANNIIF